MWDGVVRAFKQHAADTLAHLKAETQAVLKARTLKKCESMSGALSRSAPLCFWHLLRRWRVRMEDRIVRGRLSH